MLPSQIINSLNTLSKPINKYKHKQKQNQTNKQKQKQKNKNKKKKPLNAQKGKDLHALGLGWSVICREKRGSKPKMNFFLFFVAVVSMDYGDKIIDIIWTLLIPKCFSRYVFYTGYCTWNVEGNYRYYIRTNLTSKCCSRSVFYTRHCTWKGKFNYVILDWVELYHINVAYLLWIHDCQHMVNRELIFKLCI